MNSSKLYIFVLALWLISCGGKKPSNNQKMEEKPVKNLPAEQTTKPVLMFFGNSITAGYELDPDEAFPALIEDKMDTLGYDYEVINAGLSGETSAGGLERIDWVLRTVPDIFVLELGANDGLRGLNLKDSKKNLQRIIYKVKQVNSDVKVVIAGMLMPPNLGRAYTEEFKQVFLDLAEENDAVLIPFLLEGVGAVPEMNLGDGIHPNAKGHMLIAKTVWKYLEPVLEK